MYAKRDSNQTHKFVRLRLYLLGTYVSSLKYYVAKVGKNEEFN